MINNMLHEHLNKFVIAYLDNILIYLETLKEHRQHVNTIFRCLDKYDLRLKLGKCEFYKIEVLYLGFHVGINRVKISDDKIKKVKN